LKRIVHLKEKGGLNANKKNIEYKYSLLTKKICRNHKERMGSFIPIPEKSREKH
jgi:hypothetical protein